MTASLPSQILAELRAHCQPWHEQLHQHPLLVPLNDGALTMERYHMILKAFYSIYRKTEKLLETVELTISPSAPALAWLEEDINHQQLNVVDLSLFEPPSLAPLSAAFGYLYVKQGSTLGGQVISKRLEKLLGLRPGTDNHFFNGYGPATGAKWKEFTQALEAAEDRLDISQTVTTAIAFFQAIDHACTTMLTKEKYAA